MTLERIDHTFSHVGNRNGRVVMIGNTFEMERETRYSCEGIRVLMKQLEAPQTSSGTVAMNFQTAHKQTLAGDSPNLLLSQLKAKSLT